MSTVQDKDEAAIFGRALDSENATLSIDAARSILGIELSADDKSELERLAGRSKDGTLTRAEEDSLDSYRHVGRLLELMKSKARISLKAANRNA